MAGMRGYNPRRTICEVIRDINDLVQGDSERDKQIRVLLAEAFGMGKSIIAKLVQYNKTVNKSWWQANPAYNAQIKAELRRGLDYKVAEVPGKAKKSS